MDSVLAWFGPEVYAACLRRIREFWAGRGRCLVTVNTAKHGYRQVFDDAAIVERAPLNLQEQGRLPGVNLLAFFADFGIPCLKRLQAAFGGLHIHCCGHWGRHVPALRASGLRILAAEFHYPDTKVEELAGLADGTVFIPYILLNRQDQFRSTVEYYRYLLTQTPATFRYWFPFTDENPEALRFAAEFGG